ncbi:MAG TPA: UvrD-helicase domain-containing protein [Euzebyales bacterium]|nr:UvrD-helicase domain-containing protein [Euzebyales bacterium]
MSSTPLFTDASPELIEGLNPAQRDAVLHMGGPLLVIAGAGSGKTRVLAHRIAHLVHDHKVDPHGILAITFTNKAATEMQLRVAGLIGDSVVGLVRRADGQVRPRRWGGMWVSTFHAACARLLRAEIARLGYDSSFTIYDTDDSRRLLAQCIDELDMDPKRIAPRAAGAMISRAKNELIDFETYANQAEDWFAQQVAEVYRLYQDRLQRASALDFDDLLTKTVELLMLFDDVLERYQSKFRHIMVDEWQDTNHAQYVLVQMLASEHRNLAVVGDADQCLPAGTLVSTPSGPRPIEEITPGDAVLATTGQRPLGASRVTAVMPGAYHGPLWRVRAGGRTVTGTPHHVLPARVVPLDDRWFVYLMHRADRGYRIGVTKGRRPPVAGHGGEPGYVVRANQEHADKLWILRVCAHLAEAAYWEARYAATYGLPTACFHGMGRKLAMDESWLARLYADLDTSTAAKRLMKDLELHSDYPHHRPANGARRQTVTLMMYGDRRATAAYHRIQWTSIRADIAERLRAAGYLVRDNSRGGFRVETSRKLYTEALDYARGMSDAAGLDIRRRAWVHDQAYELLPLSHLHPGMRMLVEEDGELAEVEVDEVEQIDYDGPVYDLQVEPAQTYVADGVLVHNSIYRFRGADIRNILDFERDFPDATRITLDRNYRSTQTILDAANAVIANNTQRLDKQLWTDLGQGAPVVRYTAENAHDEAAFVAEEVDRLVDEHGYEPGDCAVFYRTNAQSRVLEEVLIRTGTPYQVIGGTKFYERKEIKDLLAYLQLLVNPADDVAARRVINTPRRGIGSKTEQVLSDVALRERITFVEACRRAEEHPQLGPRSVSAVLEFVSVLDQLREIADAGDLPKLVEETWTRTGYLAELEAQRTVEAQGRIENISELRGVAADFVSLQPDATLAEFLERIALVTEADALDDGAQRSRLVLMTMHNAKGLEYRVVFVIGMEDSVFPHHRALSDPDELEEERRLCYVAFTRARERLYVTSAWSRTLFGATNANPPSRFLREVPESLIEVRRDSGSPARRVAAREADDSGEEFAVGMRVLHTRFGAGRILELSGSPGSQEALIRFDESGTKRLLLTYAPLVRV